MIDQPADPAISAGDLPCMLPYGGFQTSPPPPHWTVSERSPTWNLFHSQVVCNLLWTLLGALIGMGFCLAFLAGAVMQWLR
jgi:hypothetical protein